MGKFPDFVGVKLPAEVFREVQRRAREDERTISAFLRRLITAAVQPAETPAPPSPEA